MTIASRGSCSSSTPTTGCGRAPFSVDCGRAFTGPASRWSRSCGPMRGGGSRPAGPACRRAASPTTSATTGSEPRPWSRGSWCTVRATSWRPCCDPVPTAVAEASRARAPGGAEPARRDRDLVDVRLDSGRLTTAELARVLLGLLEPKGRDAAWAAHDPRRRDGPRPALDRRRPAGPRRAGRGPGRGARAGRVAGRPRGAGLVRGRPLRGASSRTTRWPASSPTRSPAPCRRPPGRGPRPGDRLSPAPRPWVPPRRGDPHRGRRGGAAGRRPGHALRDLPRPRGAQGARRARPRPRAASGQRRAGQGAVPSPARDPHRPDPRRR